MFDQIRARLSSAHLIAFAALLVALGGTAYAATKIDTEDIKNKAVTKKKLDKAAVSTNRIVDGAVQAAKLGDAAVTTDKLADTAVRAAKLGDLREVEETTTVNQNTTGGVTADCDNDERVISGGYETPPVANQFIIPHENKRDDNGWRVSGLAFGNVNLTVYAYCLEA